ncbi:hypothetical protein DFH06DRAFT_1386858 [Mycena polygramma]|nr:hypothetical protein DFH06DRAFT_1386858 [Mycena polygramma]
MFELPDHSNVGQAEVQLATSLEWLHSGPIDNLAGGQLSPMLVPAEIDMYPTDPVQLVDTCLAVGGMSPSFVATIRTAMKRSKSTRTAPTPIACNYTPPMRPTPAVVQPQLRTSPLGYMLDDESAPPTPDVLILRSFRRMSYTQTVSVYEPLW